jgi:hypothetical protein
MGGRVLYERYAMEKDAREKRSGLGLVLVLELGLRGED